MVQSARLLGPMTMRTVKINVVSSCLSTAGCIRQQYAIFAGACLILWAWQALPLAIGPYLDSLPPNRLSKAAVLLSGAQLLLLRGVPMAIALLAILPLMLLLFAGLSAGGSWHEEAKGSHTHDRNAAHLRNWLVVHGCVILLGVALIAIPRVRVAATSVMLPGLFAFYGSLGASLAFAVHVQQHLHSQSRSTHGGWRAAVLGAVLYAFLAEVAVLLPIWVLVRSRRVPQAHS